MANGNDEMFIDTSVAYSNGSPVNACGQVEDLYTGNNAFLCEGFRELKQRWYFLCRITITRALTIHPQVRYSSSVSTLSIRTAMQSISALISRGMEVAETTLLRQVETTLWYTFIIIQHRIKGHTVTR